MSIREKFVCVALNSINYLHVELDEVRGFIKNTCSLYEDHNVALLALLPVTLFMLSSSSVSLSEL